MAPGIQLGIRQSSLGKSKDTESDSLSMSGLAVLGQGMKVMPSAIEPHCLTVDDQLPAHSG